MSSKQRQHLPPCALGAKNGLKSKQRAPKQASSTLPLIEKAGSMPKKPGMLRSGPELHSGSASESSAEHISVGSTRGGPRSGPVSGDEASHTKNVHPLLNIGVAQSHGCRTFGP